MKGFKVWGLKVQRMNSRDATHRWANTSLGEHVAGREYREALGKRKAEYSQAVLAVTASIQGEFL
jgi:hypothetical protein